LRDIVACEAAVGIPGSGVTSGRPAWPARRNLHTSYTPPPCHLQPLAWRQRRAQRL